MPKFDGYDFWVGRTIHADPGELAILAAFRKSDPALLVEACLECGSICLERKWCSCCKGAPVDVLFNSGAIGKRAKDRGEHERIPDMQLDEAVRKAMAA